MAPKKSTLFKAILKTKLFKFACKKKANINKFLRKVRNEAVSSVKFSFDIVKNLTLCTESKNDDF